LKKLIAFLVLLGAALLVLRYFERRGAVEPPRDGGRPEEPTTGEGGGNAPPPGGGAEQGGARDGAGETEQKEPFAGIAINDAVTAEIFEKPGPDPLAPRTLLLRVASKDSRTDALDVGQTGTLRFEDVLLGAKVTVVDRESKEDQVEMDATEIRFSRSSDTSQSGSGLVGLTPKWDAIARLSEVRGRLLGGAPFVPLDFAAPTATLDWTREDARTLVAPGDVVATSAALDASGKDFSVSIDAGTYSFARA